MRRLSKFGSFSCAIAALWIVLSTPTCLWPFLTTAFVFPVFPPAPAWIRKGVDAPTFHIPITFTLPYILRTTCRCRHALVLQQFLAEAPLSVAAKLNRQGLAGDIRCQIYLLCFGKRAYPAFMYKNIRQRGGDIHRKKKIKYNNLTFCQGLWQDRYLSFGTKDTMYNRYLAGKSLLCNKKKHACL